MKGGLKLGCTGRKVMHGTGSPRFVIYLFTPMCQAHLAMKCCFSCTESPAAALLGHFNHGVLPYQTSEAAGLM